MRKASTRFTIRRSTGCSLNRRCSRSMPAAPSTAANRPPRSALATSRFRIRERIQRRARSSEATQKKWFMDQLRQSKATWKIWGNSQGALDHRVDPQNLARWTDQEEVAGRHIRLDGHPRLGQRVPRARRNL